MKIFLPLALILLLAGCAQSQSPSPSGAAGPSAPEPLPTLTQPTAPPSDPTDRIKKTDVVVGTVTRGGTGPCYGLTTDDGRQYALYEAAGRELVKGTRMTVTTTPSRLRINCGEGTLVEITAIAPLR